MPLALTPDSTYRLLKFSFSSQKMILVKQFFLNQKNKQGYERDELFYINRETEILSKLRAL